jgi:hypothetical protein
MYSILLAVVATLVASGAPAPNPDSLFVPVGPAESFIVPQGSDLLGSRVLYIGRIWENHSDTPIRPVVGYSVYDSDGELFGGCEARAERVEPGKRVDLFCSTDVAVRSRRGDVITSRIASLSASPLLNGVDAAVIDSHVDSHKEGWGFSDYSVRANLQARGSRDLSVVVNFYLLNKDGVLLANCFAGTPRLQPEVARRVEVSSCARIPRHLGGADSLIVLVSAQ